MSELFIIEGELSIDLELDGEADLDLQLDGDAGLFLPVHPRAYRGSATATPAEDEQTIPTGGLMMPSDITVKAIPPQYIVPSGTKEITENGEHDVTEYAAASVNVEPTLQVKAVFPDTYEQTVAADGDYDGLSQVTVSAMPPGSATTPDTTLTADPSISVSSSGLITAVVSGATAVTPTVEAGYVDSGTAGSITVSGESTSQLTTQAAATVTPTTSQQTAIAAGTYATGDVVVDPIPSEYIIPSGTKSITENGTGIDVTEYAAVDVAVQGGTVNLQTKSASYSPSTNQQTDTITADDGYDGLEEVNVIVSAMPSGSAATPATTITANPSISISDSGLITATASATKSVTPSVSPGYVSSGTAGTITVSGSNTSQLSTVNGTTITPTTSEQTAVAKNKYTLGAVKVGAMPAGTAGTPSASKGSVSNHAVSVTPSVTNTTGYITGSTKTGTPVTVSAGELVSGTKSITSNGTGIDVTNYAAVDVSVSGGQPNLQTKTKSYTPTETAQSENVTADSGYDALEKVSVSVGAIPSDYVGSGITQRSSSDLTASGATVTVPKGYYSSQASKSVSTGSATPAASISATGATLSTGTNTLTLTKSVSNTPQVSAGYVSSGTSGNSSVSLTASVTTQAAQTIYPSTSDQSIASGRYLTGAQTIKAVTTSNLTAENIKSGVTVTVGDSANASRIASILGTYTGGGGGGGIGTLLATLSLGTISTSSTQAADTGKSISVSGVNNYDLLIVETSVDTVTNNRHTATVGLIFLTASSTVGTKDGATVATAKWNSKISSSAVTTTRAGTTAYGIYPNSCSVSTSNSVTTATIPLYRRYNSTSTGTINGNYTARVYGVNLYDLIGG